MFIPIEELPSALDSEASVNSRLQLIHRDYLLKADNKWLFSAYPWADIHIISSEVQGTLWKREKNERESQKENEGNSVRHCPVGVAWPWYSRTCRANVICVRICCLSTFHHGGWLLMRPVTPPWAAYRISWLLGKAESFSSVVAIFMQATTIELNRPKINEIMPGFHLSWNYTSHVLSTHP